MGCTRNQEERALRKKSHISLARFIVQDMQIPAMEEHWKAFYLGSILPDCVPSFLTTKHEFDGTFDRVKNRISGLLEDEKGLEEHARVFMRRLGEVLHYLADYFTFPHNKIYPGNIKDHCYYEKELKFKLREYVSSGEAFQDRIETPELQTKEAVFQFRMPMRSICGSSIPWRKTACTLCGSVIRWCKPSYRFGSRRQHRKHQ